MCLESRHGVRTRSRAVPSHREQHKYHFQYSSCVCGHRSYIGYRLAAIQAELCSRILFVSLAFGKSLSMIQLPSQTVPLQTVCQQSPQSGGVISPRWNCTDKLLIKVFPQSPPLPCPGSTFLILCGLCQPIQSQKGSVLFSKSLADSNRTLCYTICLVSLVCCEAEWARMKWCL